MREATIRLGTSGVAVTYPADLDQWLDGLVEPGPAQAVRHKWVRVQAGAEPGRFDVTAGRGGPATRLEIGDALAAFWEHVSFLLIDDLSDAFAVHASVLRRGDGVVLLPGCSGAGKTRLALWYRTRGFELGSDEVVLASASTDDQPILRATLARPVILKTPQDVSACLDPGETPVAQATSENGLLLRLIASGWSERALTHALLVFPRFLPGAAFKLAALSPGEACLHLLESCLNARNLPRGGLALAALLARQLPAVAVEYGNTSQLEGSLDLLTRQLLAAKPSAEDLVAICDTYTTAAAARAAVVAPTPAPTPHGPVPAATVARYARRLTVGMATYDDYDGVYFTIQSIRLNNPELVKDLEFVVIDNHPGGPASGALGRLEKWIEGYRYVPRGDWNGTAVRNAVFEEASSNLVLCLDSHVLIVPGALAKLIAYHEAAPESRDLLQGPLIYDNLQRVATHMEPRWRAAMYGVWGEDARGTDPAAPAFDIPMQGLGLFACRRNAWVGFSALFRGFGAEEGYIHEKTRRYGGRTLCLPFLRWLHRFERPRGVPYPIRWEDRIRNYLVAFSELDLDTTEMEAHFAELLGVENAARMLSAARQELGLV